VTGNPQPAGRSGAHGGASGDQALYCRTCHRPLTPQLRAGSQPVYHHAEQLRGGTVDHPADPVPVTEIAAPVLECDFCSGPDPVWAYLGDDQHTHAKQVTAKVVSAGDYRDRHHAARARRVETRHAFTSAWGQRWSACQPCAVLVEARDLYGLIGRVVDAMPAKYTRGNRLVRVRGELHGTYSHLFDTLAPGRGRITAEHPLGLWQPAPAAPE
jgi:hypothetical protein